MQPLQPLAVAQVRFVAGHVAQLPRVDQQLLADRIGHGDQHQAPRTLFRKFVDATAEHAITVQFGRRANNAFLVKQGFAGEQCRIPWPGYRVLRLALGENGQLKVTS